MDARQYILPLLLLLPTIGGLCLTRLTPGRNDWVRNGAFVTTLLTFLVSCFVFLFFDFHPDRGQVTQLLTELPWFDALGLSFTLGLDEVSLWLVLLTTFLMPLVVLGSYTAVQERVKEFYVWLLLLQTAMLGVFLAQDIIFFYICFEFTLIPMYFLIGIYGSSQRLRAARVFFLYTFTGSMLTFAGVLYVAWWAYSLNGVWNFNIRALIAAASDRTTGMTEVQQYWVMLAMLAGFAVKVPVFPFHTWLPLAHTEAPTAGSVVLAGVLLKLGTFAMIRLAIPIAPIAALDFAPYMGLLAIAGIVGAALICWVQKDIKKLIAYSSVSHLGFCVLGMFALNDAGLSGSVIYMINHGLSTGALFLLVGMIYERFHTREMAQMSGLGRAMPIWASFMVFFCLASVGLPGLNGFVGEFLTLKGAFDSTLMGPVYAAAAGLGLVLGAIYILHMVGSVVWGPVRIPAHDGGHDAHAATGGSHGDSHSHSHDHSHAQPKVKDLTGREILVLIPLAAACLWLGLMPNCILTTLDRPSIQLAKHVGTSEGQPGRIFLPRYDSPSVLHADELPATEATHRTPPAAPAAPAFPAPAPKPTPQHQPEAK